MEKKNFYLFGFLLLLTTLSESRVIVPRGIQNFANSENGKIPFSLNPLGNANKPAFSPEISNKPTSGDDFGVYDYGVQPFDYDYEVPGEIDKKDVDDGSKVNPEKFPSDVDPTEGPLKDTDEKDDGSLNKNPDADKFGDDSKDSEGDSKPTEDKDKSIPKDKDEFPIDNDIDVKSEEDDSVKKQPGHDEGDDKLAPEDEENRVPEDEDKDDSKDDESKEHDKDEEEAKEHDKDEDESKEHDKDEEESKEHDMDEEESKEHDMDEEESNEHDNDDEEPKEHKDDEEHEENDDDKDIHAAEDAEPFSGGSIFDTPFFNYERVKNYFGLLERALGHVFRETMDEAKLLNGTYANTTEEEVDIDGKKYVVQKSVIKSADNHSTIYVETLSTKSKVNDTKEVQDMELKNVTNV